MANIANIFKIITLVIGAVVVGLGYHAFFESDFNEQNKHSDNHKACKQGAEMVGKTCPPIAYEIVFLSAATVAFIFSIVSSLVSLTNHSHNLTSAFKIVDLVFHILAGLLLMVGGSLLVVSAVQIYSFVKLSGIGRNVFDLYDEKISAGGICLLNGIIYIITGVLAYRTANNPSQETQGQVYAAKLPQPQFPQNYGQQNLPPPDYPRHTFGAQNNSNQNYSQQNNAPQNYNNQNYPPPFYASQNYNNQTQPQQNYASQNYNNQFQPQQNYASQNYNNQSYPQRSFTPQNNVPQTYPATHYGGEKY